MAHIANRVLAPDANPVILPIAFLLNGIGYMMIVRIDLALNQQLTPPSSWPGPPAGWPPTS